MHNRCAFGSTLAKNGVVIRPAGLEATEQIGRVERRGDMLKKMMSNIVEDTHASGRESMDMNLSESLNAANETTRHGGFAPRFPRSPATKRDEDVCLDVGVPQAHADGPTTSVCSHVTERTHVKHSCRGARAGEHGLQWSVGFRLISFEKHQKQLR